MTLTTHQTGAKNAPTIVFLHGLGVSSWMWTDQIEMLQTDFHCLAIDLPGNGESYQTTWTDFADSAAQVADVIRTQATGGEAHVVGLSLGGYVALHLLANSAEIVQSMVVSGVTIEPLVRPSFVNPLSRLSAKLVKSQLLAGISARMMQLPPEAIPLYKRDIGRLSDNAVYRVYQEVLDFKLPHIEPDNASKLLLVAGDKEVKAVQRSLHTFAATHPQTTVAQAPNAHHGWNAEHPILFTKMVAAWQDGAALPTELTLHNAPTLTKTV